MSFLSSLGVIAEIDSAIQQGRGAVAAVLGQTYTQYRMSTLTSGSIVSGTPVTNAFPARIRRTTKTAAIEGDILQLLCFEATCDNRTLELGDVFVENGYEAMEGGTYVFAQERPTRETLWMRAESACQITRPTPGAGNPEQMPSSGAIAIYGMQGITSQVGDSVLNLTNGSYSFEAAGTPASVQCGLQPMNRIRDGRLLGTPTDQPRAHYLIYVPLLPGEQLQEFDRIQFPNADSYEVLVVYPSVTGLVGYICICEKLGSA